MMLPELPHGIKGTTPDTPPLIPVVFSSVKQVPPPVSGVAVKLRTIGPKDVIEAYMHVQKTNQSMGLETSPSSRALSISSRRTLATNTDQALPSVSHIHPEYDAVTGLLKSP